MGAASTRRSILLGVAAMPFAGAAVAGQVTTETDPDAALHALCREHAQVQRLYHVLHGDDEWDELAKASSTLCLRIAGVPATTRAGLAAKAWVVAQETRLSRVLEGDERFPCPEDYDDTRVLASLLRDLLRDQPRARPILIGCALLVY